MPGKALGCGGHRTAWVFSISMSNEAFEGYARDLKEQHSRNEARSILRHVQEARQSLHRAGARWPFELLQNSLDAGPRPGFDTVSIALRHQDLDLEFEH